MSLRCRPSSPNARFPAQSLWYPYPCRPRIRACTTSTLPSFSTALSTCPATTSPHTRHRCAPVPQVPFWPIAPIHSQWNAQGESARRCCRASAQGTCNLCCAVRRDPASRSIYVHIYSVRKTPSGCLRSSRATWTALTTQSKVAARHTARPFVPGTPTGKRSRQQPRQRIDQQTPRLKVSVAQGVVGVRGFEPPTPASRTQYSTRLSYTPTVISSVIAADRKGG